MEDRPTLSIRKPWLPVLVTLTLTAGLGGWVGWQWQALEQRARQEQEGRFNFEVDYIEHRLRERMQAYEMVLRGLAGFIAARDKVSPEDWLKTTDQLQLQEIYPGIQAVSLALYARNEQLQALVNSISRERPDFHVYPEGKREEYVVVEYTHPQIWRNRKVLGFDLMSESVRHETIVYARDTGFPVVTGPLRLLQETDENAQRGVLLFLPIYKTSAPISSADERRKAFLGVLYGAFRLDDLMEGILKARKDLFRLQIVDFAEPAQPLLKERLDESIKASYRDVRHIHMYGRNWQLMVTSTPQYELIVANGSRAFSLFAGLASVLLFSMLVGGYLYVRERALASSQAMTLELREREARFRLLIEKLPVATLLCDEHGRIELANRSAATLLNVDIEQLLGNRLSYYLPDVLNGAHGIPVDTEILARQATGEPLPVTLNVTRFRRGDGLRYVLNLVDLRAFKRAEERFRDMVEGLPNAFVLSDCHGQIVTINRQTEMMFGYSRQELIGQPLGTLLPESTQRNHQELCLSFEKHPEPFRIGRNREVFGLHKDGRMLPLEVGLAPLRSGDELLVQSVLIDITHRKNAELRLRDQADQLATVNRYKSEFLANMSHELRTPLNSILILSDQLRDNRAGNLSEKQVHHADIIHRAGSDLLRLINDVLDLSRIEVGRLQLNLETLDIAGLLGEIEDSLQPLAEQKGLHLYTRIEPNTPARIVSDRGRLQQILRNLLSNALKFTEQGEVEVIARGVSDEPGGEAKRIQLAVRDTGIGIPTDEFKRIFLAFQQIDGSISRRYGGAGLGLAISQQLVEVLQGSLSVESSLGMGSTFTIELPLAVSSPEDEVEQFLASRGRYLLIVSEDLEYVRQAMEVGQIYGFDSMHCVNGQDAIEALQDKRFAAVLLDLQLSDMSGWQCYQQVRADEHHHDVPVVILANAPQAHDWHDGALRYLLKPVSRTDLQRLFVEWLRCEGNPERLLLVEAEPERAQRLRDHFERIGYSVTLTDRSEDARLAFAERHFKVLVIDFDLPEADGMDLLEALDRLRPLGKETKVIVYSRDSLPESELYRLQHYSGTSLARNDDVAQFDAILMPKIEAPLASLDAVGQPWLGRKVLLVDADVKNIFVMSGLLDEFGLQTTPATGFAEALLRFEESVHDLVLLAPINDGDIRDLIKTLREEHGCQVPILCLDPARREALIEAGADDGLAGPFERDSFAVLVQRWLGRITASETG
ncbi:CHASE domain-containing protein [Azomonas macrocytogenes]|uniref:histidine kinase n=1 Tax=Azomonas macrocytogenes TaxID=69962 RepID=A0A839T2E4_AZOMA|nr:CHASE domain-containing protein [Azomonas macrocytogenes]MBB3103582.1 PAS domain S-box-containing protein [Azomonas macrocytogenes]